MSHKSGFIVIYIGKWKIPEVNEKHSLTSLGQAVGSSVGHCMSTEMNAEMFAKSWGTVSSC